WDGLHGCCFPVTARLPVAVTGAAIRTYAGRGRRIQPMRTDRPETATAGSQAAGFRGFFEEDRPLVRLVPGEGRMPEGLQAAVLQGLSDAPALFVKVLGLRPPQRPYQRVEVTLAPGSDTQGEAVSLGPGVLRLVVGEETTSDDAARIARHEALHLLLASRLR